MSLAATPIRRFGFLVIIGLLASVFSTHDPLSASAGDEAGARDEVLAAYPGIQVRVRNATTTVLGVPMNSAADPDTAAAEWLRMHARALGVAPEQFHETLRLTLSDGKIVFGYTQEIPLDETVRTSAAVVDSCARIVVLPVGEEWRVVYVSAANFVRSVEAIDAPVIERGLAEQAARAEDVARDLDQWKEPRLVVLGTGGMRNGQLAYHFEARSTMRAKMASYSIYVSARDGSVVRVEDEIRTADVDGTVTGYGSPGTKPDTSGNTPEEMPLPGVIVTVDGSDTETDDDGEYLDDGVAEGDTVDVDAALEGIWVDLVAAQGSVEDLSDTVEAPGSVDFVFNEGEDEFETAQVNAIIHVHRTHEFVKSGLPDLDAIDERTNTWVNIDDACNAFYDPFDDSINFFNEDSVTVFGTTTTCVNTCYSTVISHEYGHYLLDKLGVVGGSFGEGYSDVLAMMIFDVGVVGEDFSGTGTVIREYEENSEDYPCFSSSVHLCGEVLAGAWWDLRENLAADLGSDDDGLAATRDLFLKWTAITDGAAESGQAADEHVAEQVLIADDDDGILANGTPNLMSICDAFDDHSVDCPDLPPVSFVFPDGRPEFLDPDGSTTFDVEVIDLSDSWDGASVLLYVSTNGEDFKEEELDASSSDDRLFTIELPSGECGTIAYFYLVTEDDDSDEVSLPLDAPDELFAIPYADELDPEFFVDDFESDLDWDAGVSGDDATTGEWVRVDPNPTLAQPGNDHTADGDTCYVTGQASAGSLDGAADIDGGKTTLRSPLFDLSEPGLYRISYWRWYSNQLGAAPGADEFEVDISDDDGDTWTNVETVGPDTDETFGGWIFHSFFVSDFVEATDSVMIRFIASDEGEGSLVEAAVDDFVIEHFSCVEEDGPEFQRADCGGDGSFNIADVLKLLAVIFGDETMDCDDACDANDNGSVEFIDAFQMLDTLFGDETIPEPFGECGVDGTDDTLECETIPESCE